MTASEGGDRTTSAVLAWCDWYTRGLPDDVASARRDELTADLHDHRVDASRRDEVDGRLARAVVARALLGAPADLSWRSHQLRIARSARRQEKQMDVTPRRDGRTTVAYVLGGLVVAWSALNVAMLWNLVSVSSNDEDRSVGVGYRPDRAGLPRSVGVGADRADPSPEGGRIGARRLGRRHDGLDDLVPLARGRGCGDRRVLRGLRRTRTLGDAQDRRGLRGPEPDRPVGGVAEPARRADSRPPPVRSRARSRPILLLRPTGRMVLPRAIRMWSAYRSR